MVFMELYRRNVASSGMPPLGVVEHLDVIEHWVAAISSFIFHFNKV
jgi:hypothetical protein